MFHVMFIQGTMIDFEHFMLQSRLYNIYCIIILRGPAYIWLNNSLKKAYTRQKTFINQWHFYSSVKRIRVFWLKFIFFLT